ncbi:hypothetical protein LWC34_09545 [Kibdelosporangium philippinense]|uniref:Uncharacterized protein n=1 Tax=Kibdelosporangium philippinense TaxID=211113 RepID=A0ABS8Z7M8_9PSEU|nr:hypothetical protein [Kibdelosporangium philippinense]MCE7003069.1 hypothetical protein [Kibdelosporangium philippinense]
MALLAEHPATCGALASLLGCTDPWQVGPTGVVLLDRYPDTAIALEELMTT